MLYFTIDGKSTAKLLSDLLTDMPSICKEYVCSPDFPKPSRENIDSQYNCVCDVLCVSTCMSGDPPCQNSGYCYAGTCSCSYGFSGRACEIGEYLQY